MVMQECFVKPTAVSPSLIDIVFLPITFFTVTFIKCPLIKDDVGINVFSFYQGASEEPGYPSRFRSV